MTDKEQIVSTKPYAAPTLVVYGAMADMTAAGSMGQAEGMAMTNQMRMA